MVAFQKILILFTHSHTRSRISFLDHNRSALVICCLLPFFPSFYSSSYINFSGSCGFLSVSYNSCSQQQACRQAPCSHPAVPEAKYCTTHLRKLFKATSPCCPKQQPLVRAGLHLFRCGTFPHTSFAFVNSAFHFLHYILLVPQNHRTIRIGRDRWTLSSPMGLSRQGRLEHVTQERVQVGSERL